MGLDLSCCKDFRFHEGRKMAAPWVSSADAEEGVHPMVEAGSRAGRVEAGP